MEHAEHLKDITISCKRTIHLCQHRCFFANLTKISTFCMLPIPICITSYLNLHAMQSASRITASLSKPFRHNTCTETLACSHAMHALTSPSRRPAAFDAKQCKSVELLLAFIANRFKVFVNLPESAMMLRWTSCDSQLTT